MTRRLAQIGKSADEERAQTERLVEALRRVRAFRRFRLKQESPEQQYAQDHQDGNDDDFDKAHSRFPTNRYWVPAQTGD
jgi:hypothetical protein